ncbi:response regulator [Thalassospira sp. TSL5-1]|uniref:response regulator n=1 Tax=Thalassospira sp. TSL5-1 TaxID=1544451 RepID=UPI00093FB1A0|nr:response regulator [Thalassospira sp. TSL5-1]OKH86266.1 hypothetical protein LF95_23580 [Thalassospira sp. TSL5-1]
MSDGKKILVLENEPITQSLLKAILRKEGYQVTITASYDEAERAWQRDSFDLVIADYYLEGALTGADFVSHMRNCDGVNRFPAIALSIADEVENSDAINQAGFDFFLPKPIDVRILTGTIEKLLQPSQ